MDYPEFKRNWDGARGPVLDLVQQVERRLLTETRLDAPELAREFPDFPFSPRLWQVWLGNTVKLQGVKRRDRFPYATHPTRMALICCWLIDDVKTREDSGVLAIVHDYLEEGDGLNREGLEAMRKQFPAEPSAGLAGVFLSEPIIDYVSLGRASELSFWRRVAYVLQAEEAIQQLGDAFANAALADKIDNLHDLDYIALDARLSPEKRAAKLAQRVGYFTFVERILGPYATPKMRRILAAGIVSRITEFGLDAAAVEREAEELAERARGKGSVIARMTREYQRSLGLSFSST